MVHNTFIQQHTEKWDKDDDEVEGYQTPTLPVTQDYFGEDKREGRPNTRTSVLSLQSDFENDMDHDFGHEVSEDDDTYEEMDQVVKIQKRVLSMIMS